MVFQTVTQYKIKNVYRTGKFALCIISISGRDEIIGGPGIGKRCHFPFEYKGIMHYGCTTEDSLGQPWCSASSNFSNHAFGYCDCPFDGNIMPTVYFGNQF